MPDRRYADEWLPSRFSLGILRFVAWVIARGLEDGRPESGAYLNRERHQHPLEATLLSIALWAVPTLQITLLVSAATTRPWTVAPLAFAVTLVLVPLAWVLVAIVFTLPAKGLARLTGRTTHDIQTSIAFLGMLGLAISSIARDWPGALIGWVWIALVIVEIIGRLICLALRVPFAALDKRIPARTP